MAYNPVAQGARCALCPLRGHPFVPPQPHVPGKTLRLIIVNEPIGRAEEKMRTPLAGRTGGLVKSTVEASGIRVAECHITPSALCRAETDKEADLAAVCCAPRLLRELASLDAAVPIVALGKQALASVLAGRKLLYSRGFLWQVKAPRRDAVKVWERSAARMPKGVKRDMVSVKVETVLWRRRLRKRWVMVSLAPSFITRADTWAPLFRIDVARAIRMPAIVAAGLEDDATHTVWPGARAAARKRKENAGASPESLAEQRMHPAGVPAHLATPSGTDTKTR